MQSRMFLLSGVLLVGILGPALPVPAYNGTNAYDLERAEISGFVVAVENQVAYIQTDYGQQIAVQLGPEFYWNAHHYYLPEGDYVEMEVWYDPMDRYTEWYFAGEIWGPDFHFVLTNNEGVPYWIIFNDDYYYSLGYRASCVSYMVWYDCPPIYFVYLILPPPPPRIYICFYGPRWRHHHSDWHYGPRFCSGGSYWNDGHGYERPHQPRNDPRNRNNARSRGYISDNDSDEHPLPPATLPVAKPQPRDDQWQKWPTKPQPGDNRTVVVPRTEYRKQTVASIPLTERKTNALKSVPQKRQIQPRSDNQTRQDVRGSSVERNYAPPVKSKLQNSQSHRTPKSEKNNSPVEHGRSLKKGSR